jgi:flagellar assembly protein FliH
MPKQEAPAEDLVSRAHLAEVEAQAETRVREAHSAGFAEGRRAAGAELESTLQQMAKSIEELSRMKARLRKEAEADLVTLTLAVARRILRRELTVDEGALQGVVCAALEKLQVRDLLQVRVHPTHEKFLRQSLASTGAAGVTVTTDNSLKVGDLLFETARGTVDASLDSQLLEIERGFADVLAR